jgi:hypothetical protein
LHCKLQTHPLVREGALHEERKKVIAEQRKWKSGHGLKRGPDTKTKTVSRNITRTCWCPETETTSLSIGTICVGSIWIWRQNPVSETLCL